MKYWTKPVPEKCDNCEEPITDVFFDAVTRHGPWGNLCANCFLKHGIGIGTGMGQCYQKQNSEFVKVEFKKDVVIKCSV